MMKFSVLLPTRNRLELLRFAVECVLRQDYDEWELIVSDNASDEDIFGYISSLSDPRLKYFGLNEFVPVTDNWNNALKQSTGDYIIMLGDDDCLMPNYFKIMSKLIMEYDFPEFIYTDAYLYAYPQVLAEHPTGYLRNSYNEYFSTEAPFLIHNIDSNRIVRKSLSLTECVRYNMQLSLLSREFVNSLVDRGPFFQSIYPDFYATVVAFLKSKRTLIFQKPVVTIGISPRSFGVFHFSGREESGKEFLYKDTLNKALEPLKNIVLPGDFTYTGWLSAMNTISENYPREILSLRGRVGYKRYRWLQIIYMYKNHLADQKIPKEEFTNFKKRLSLTETVLISPFLHCLFSVLGKMNSVNRDKIIQIIRQVIGRPNIFKEDREVQEYSTILDVYEKMPPLTLDIEDSLEH